jgi:catechol 2,3-dioxygenase-like lactoylglutathione lyase family enzyme
VNIWFEGLTLPVSDLDTSIRFYESLGFVTEIRVERFGLLRFGSGTLGLLAAGPRVDRDTAAGGGTLRPFVQVEMGTDDLDALYADFITRGIPVHTAPRDRGFEAPDFSGGWVLPRSDLLGLVGQRSSSVRTRPAVCGRSSSAADRC